MARINPVSYILDGLRGLFITGWDSAALTAGIIACVGISVAPFLFAMFALSARTRRK